MSEWSKVPLSKSGRVNSPRGFESHSLRCLPTLLTAPASLQSGIRTALEESHSGLVSTTGNRVGGIALVGSNPTSSAHLLHPLLLALQKAPLRPNPKLAVNRTTLQERISFPLT